ncbi:hypothetical protein [Acetobacter sp.]
MQVILILACIVIWSSIIIFYWRANIYVWLDNRFDFERLLSRKKEK